MQTLFEEAEERVDHTQHLDAGTVHAWIDEAGGLDSAESARIERHIAECRQCAAMVAEARGLVAGASRIVSSLDVVRAGVIPKSVTPAAASAARSRATLRDKFRVPPLVAALAATLLVAVASTLTVRYSARGKERAQMRSVASETVVARAAVPFAARPVATASTRAKPPAPSSRTPSAPSVAASSKTALKKTRHEVANALPSAVAQTSLGPVASPGAVSAAAGAAAPPRAQEPRLDTAAVRAMRDSAPRNRLSADRRVMRLEQVVTADARADRGPRAIDRAYLGCYSLEGDLPDWARGLPARFDLDELPVASAVAGAPEDRRIVRAVTVEQKVDGPIEGAWWQAPAAGSTNSPATVTWANGAAHLALTLDLARDGIRATVHDATHAEPVKVVRAACSP